MGVLEFWEFAHGSGVLLSRDSQAGTEILGPGSEHSAGVENLHSWRTKQVLHEVDG